MAPPQRRDGDFSPLPGANVKKKKKPHRPGTMGGKQCAPVLQDKGAVRRGPAWSPSGGTSPYLRKKEKGRAYDSDRPMKSISATPDDLLTGSTQTRSSGLLAARCEKVIPEFETASILNAAGRRRTAVIWSGAPQNSGLRSSPNLSNRSLARTLESRCTRGEDDGNLEVQGR
jgi:hypothetical protein